MPITVQIAVSTQPNCKLKPVIGPNINFNMLMAITEMYLAKFIMYSKSCFINKEMQFLLNYKPKLFKTAIFAYKRHISFKKKLNPDL